MNIQIVYVLYELDVKRVKIGNPNRASTNQSVAGGSQKLKNYLHIHKIVDA
ncbi:MAG TPA: hypothetical protein VFM79_05165 [Pelobium sp.]|nr:hypothetical protein [Pelobium sp.]